MVYVNSNLITGIHWRDFWGLC